jgi:hypothetical protein
LLFSLILSPSGLPYDLTRVISVSLHNHTTVSSVRKDKRLEI